MQERKKDTYVGREGMVEGGKNYRKRGKIEETTRLNRTDAEKNYLVKLIFYTTTDLTPPCRKLCYRGRLEKTDENIYNEVAAAQ